MRSADLLRWPQRTLSHLPRGHTLPADAWADRHRWLLVLLAGHLVGLPLFGLATGWSLVASVTVVLPAAGLGLLALWAPGRRTVRASCSALALLSCSAALVVLWHGTIEAHFHYFVVAAALALYEEWAVYGLAVGYVVLQHGLMSQLRSDVVFAHPMAMGDGHGMWFWALVHGAFILALSVVNLVTWRASEDAREQAADALASVRHQADHDQLTGLVTRRRFDHELGLALGGQRGGEVVGVLFIDLDDFKRTNDALGHEWGDEILVTVARRLTDALRPRDVVGRFGGDEFVVCLVAGGRTEVERIADRVSFALRAPVLLGHEARTMTASIGIALAETAGARGEALLRDADAAMYAAKREGKARRRTFATSVAVAGSHAPSAVDEVAPLVSSPAMGAELDRLLAGQLVHAVFQPLVDLVGEEVVGYEALARGPAGSALERPDLLFAAAAHHGRLAELDWLCRVAAVRGARAGGLGPEQTLFVNVEPAALGEPCPEHLAGELPLDGELAIVVEVTERDLTTRPAALLRAAASIRARGWGIAIDDVGADPRSLALMPLLAPDVIKLDLRLVQQRSSGALADVVSAVHAEAERTGALVVAEGIEDDQHLAAARAFGATHGQGWRFGRPGPLPDPGTRAAGGARGHVRPRPAPVVEQAATPFRALAGELAVRRGDKALLLDITRRLEEQAARIGQGAVIASAFQSAERFTPATRERYARLAHDAAMVVALGVGMGPDPAAGVRGAHLPEDDPLCGEWSVAVLGPHFAGALLAVDLGDDVEDAERRFDFALTYDRARVVRAASTLVRRLATSTADTTRVPSG